jgi:hypothetical protein
MTITVVTRHSYNNCGLMAGMRWKSGGEAVYSSLSLVRRIGKFTVFVELFVVFGYEAYGCEAGVVLIRVFKKNCDFHQPTKSLTRGGDLRFAQVDVLSSV